MTIKLSYFDFPGGRGETCRLALHVAGVDFEDDRVDPKTWGEKKAGTPFGAMPVLEVEGHGVVAQSNAILWLIGSKHGLLPKDEFAAAKALALLEAVEDLRARVEPTLRLKDPSTKQEVREEIAVGYMKSWAANMEAQLVGPFAMGEDISVADLKIYILMNWFKKGVVEFISADYFKPYKKLEALFDAVAAHPRVVHWYAQRKAS